MFYTKINLKHISRYRLWVFFLKIILYMYELLIKAINNFHHFSSFFLYLYLTDRQVGLGIFLFSKLFRAKSGNALLAEIVERVIWP